MPEKYFQYIRYSIVPKYPQNIRVEYTVENGLRFVTLTAEHNGTMKSRKFFDTRFGGNFVDLTCNKFKEGATKLLEDFIEFKARAQKVMEL